MQRFLLFLLIISSYSSFGQTPFVKQWDKRFGGTGREIYRCFEQTADGGYIIGGGSDSNADGDKTEPCWGHMDYWIVKIDSLGKMQWNKRFGGISGADILSAVHQTADGGYILGGISESDMGGDKTEPSRGGTGDYWIIKTDASGNKEWDKTFGGPGDEGGLDDYCWVQQTQDGGYIVGGSSASEVGGDKTQPKWDTISYSHDFWIVRIDSHGNKLWDKDFGGIQDEIFAGLRITRDNGFILGGFSRSGIGGDKNEANHDASLRSWDYWVVKTDSSGNFQWENGYGGKDDDMLADLRQTSDGGYIIAGTTLTGASGDVTYPTHMVDSSDYWVLKIDSTGKKQWDKCYGGIGPEEAQSVFITRDGGYLVCGDSYSVKSGDKSEDNLGSEQTWVIKIDANGVRQWDKTVLTDNGRINDEDGTSIESLDGGILMANMSWSDSGGDKSQNSWGPDFDYFIVKFKDTTACVLPKAGTVAANPKSICPGDNSMLTVSGGNGNIQWQSSVNGVTFTDIQGASSSSYQSPPLSKTTYYRVKVSGTCGRDSSKVFTLNVGKQVAGTISALRDTICQGTPGNLILTGNSSNTIQWQSSITQGNFANANAKDTTRYKTPPLSQSTWYRVVVGTGNCADTSGSFRLFVPPALVATFNYAESGSTLTYNSDSSSGTIVTYHWDFGDGSASTEKNPTHTYTKTDTTYYVCLTLYDGSNCSYTYCKYASITTGVSIIAANSGWAIYPTPFTNKIIIDGKELNKTINSVELFDVLGRVMLNKTIAEKSTNPLLLDVSVLANGVYFLHIKTSQNDYVQKVIKQ